MRRYMMRIIPRANMGAEIILKGVNILPRGFNSAIMKAIKSFNVRASGDACLPLIAVSFLCLSPSLLFLFLFLCCSVDTEQKGGPQDKNNRNGVQKARAQFREGGCPEVRAKAELFEGHGGKIKNGRGAELGFSVNLVDIAVGLSIESRPRIFKEISPGAEDQGLCRAGLDAGRDLALHEPLIPA